MTANPSGNQNPAAAQRPALASTTAPATTVGSQPTRHHGDHERERAHREQAVGQERARAEHQAGGERPRPRDPTRRRHRQQRDPPRQHAGEERVGGRRDPQRGGCQHGSGHGPTSHVLPRAPCQRLEGDRDRDHSARADHDHQGARPPRAAEADAVHPGQEQREPRRVPAHVDRVLGCSVGERPQELPRVLADDRHDTEVVVLPAQRCGQRRPPTRRRQRHREHGAPGPPGEQQDPPPGAEHELRTPPHDACRDQDRHHRAHREPQPQVPQERRCAAVGDHGAAVLQQQPDRPDQQQAPRPQGHRDECTGALRERVGRRGVHLVSVGGRRGTARWTVTTAG